MEVAQSGPQILSEPHRRKGTPLPLSQLVEESRSRTSIPNHLLDSKIYAKLKSNREIEAEPSELHFSGFEVGKSYVKVLKLINISSEAMNIHIIPTQTKHFHTTYTKKSRLIPGLDYALKVTFCPDEWRYFYDCVRVHCKDEENLLIPVHAYPVVDDLHIPPRIDLPAAPLGQSVCHTIPLRCSCPIDFEFQVFVIQQNEAFSIHPLAGVIPASGEGNISVTFNPQRYETSQFTFQLVVSQFNTKPHLCTVTGSSAPHLTISDFQLKENAELAENKRPPHATKPPPQCKRQSSSKNADKLQRDQGDAKHRLTPSVDVCTPAGVAKMLIKDVNKLTSKDLRQALWSVSTGEQSRQIKEALFLKKLRQFEKEEQGNYLKRKVHLGTDLKSEQTRRQILEERETAWHKYTVRREDVNQDEDFSAGPTKLSSVRVIRDAEKTPEGAPSFQFYTSIQWELKQRALRLFQQAARKVVIQCRMNQRLASLKKLAGNLKNPPSAQKVEEKKMSKFRISPAQVFPSSFPIFPEEEEDDPSTLRNLAEVPVDPIDVTVTTHIPFFKLQVPQHYKLMGYRPISAWEAFTNYTPTTLARPLRTGALEELQPVVSKAEEPRIMELKTEDEEDCEESMETAESSIRAPEALLRPVPANPLSIFNPTPGLKTYKPKPKYLESDLEFNLCPLSRYEVPESSTHGPRTQSAHTRMFLDQKEVIGGVTKWRSLDSISVICASERLICDSAPRRCSRVQLSPETIASKFLRGRARVSNCNLAAGAPGRHHQDHQLEATGRSEISQMGRRAMARLKQLEVADRTSGVGRIWKKGERGQPTQQLAHSSRPTRLFSASGKLNLVSFSPTCKPPLSSPPQTQRCVLPPPT